MKTALGDSAAKVHLKKLMYWSCAEALPCKRGLQLGPIDKMNLSERDICTKFISPAIESAGWDLMSQVREEVSFTAGKIIVRGKLVTRGKAKRADYILYYKPNIPIALIEAKDNKHPVGDICGSDDSDDFQTNRRNRLT